MFQSLNYERMLRLVMHNVVNAFEQSARCAGLFNIWPNGSV
jgi:hypothetical protein